MLAALLTNVNAREVTKTKTLRLWGCDEFRGAGLEPLRHSSILECIDLVTESDSPGILDEALVTDILRTMIPSISSFESELARTIKTTRMKSRYSR
jgi:hypothetical protein